MADLYSEGPIYSEIGYSKGPKSTYYGLNDQQLPASVLNVPQTDADDEWGRTQRIADERTLDFIAKIYKTLFDPFGSLCGIVLEPGTEGSEINVAKNMIRLIGRAGLEEGVFDLDIPSLTLGNIIVNGSENKIYNGSSSEISSSSLKLADNFELYSSSSDEGRLRFKSANYLRFYNNDSADPYTELIVNGKAYRFTEDTLTLPSGGTITASVLTMGGTLNSRDIIPTANDTYALGSSGYRYSNVYSVLGNFEESVFADSFRSQSFGDPTGPVTISGTSVSIYDQSNGRSLTFDGNKLNPDITGTISLGETTLRYANIYATGGNFSGTITTQGIVPSSNDTYDIGSGSLSYKTIYAGVGNFGDYVYTTHICSGGQISTHSSRFTIYYGSTEVARFGGSKFVTSINMEPESNDTYDIGTSSLRFATIYGTTVNAEYIISENLGGVGSDITICGDSITLWDTDADVSLYFKDDVFRPSTNDHVGLGNSSYRYSNVYSVLGNFEESVRADTVLCENFGDFSGSATLFGSPVILKHQSSSRSLEFDGLSFSPDITNYTSLGTSAHPFKEIWLYDGYTSTSVRVRVCNGVLEPI